MSVEIWPEAGVVKVTVGCSGSKISDEVIFPMVGFEIET
jgi:hypothetical protein